MTSQLAGDADVICRLSTPPKTDRVNRQPRAAGSAYGERVVRFADEDGIIFVARRERWCGGRSGADHRVAPLRAPRRRATGARAPHRGPPRVRLAPGPR